MINVMEVVRKLNFERLAGSAEERTAANIITGYLSDLGLEAKYEEFELTSFDTGKAEIICGDKTFVGHPFGLNKDAAITAELVFLENLEIIDYNKGAYVGKIVMGYGFTRGIASKLIENGIVGYIGIGKPTKKVNSSSHRQASNKTGYVNSINIDYNTATKLIKLNGKEITINIKQKVEKRVARNIVVDILGKGFDDTLTIAVGHYDTVALSPGATDNTGGTLSLLKMAEYFSKNQPARDLRIVFFSGEELGLLGSQAYVEANLEEIKKRVGVVINIDVTGDVIGQDHFNIIGNKNLMGYVDGITKEIGLMFNTKLDIFSSDGMPFSKYEIPSINVFRSGGEGSGNIHTADDNLKFVTAKGYENTIKASKNLLNRILNSKIYPAKREIDSSLKEIIEKYLYNLNYQKVELEWIPKYKK